MGTIDFFIIGVQKGGTTALDAFLRRHPDIQMARLKEVHHFDDESLNWNEPSHARLHEQFDWTVDDVVRGEATPIYIYWPRALERLKAYNLAAKLIIVLRHPAMRAFSHWKMEAKRKIEALPFEEAISEAARERVSRSPGGVHRGFSYIERGFYASQIGRVFSLFPEEQVHFIRTDRLWTDPMRTLRGVERFLGLGAKLAEVVSEYIVPVETKEFGPLHAHLKPKLVAMFEGDIRRTSALTGIDLDDWLDVDYAEPLPGS